MAMLQALNPSRPGSYEDREQGLDLGRLLAIARRRIFYFAIPFVLLLIAGFMIVAIQRPIYHAEGKILVESPEIPTTLVQPTVTAAAIERMQVIQQRIMNRDNLLAIVKKFGLFPSQHQWMSETQLLDLMRQRAVIELVDIDTAMSPTKDGKPAPQRPSNRNNSAVAFTIGFDYEQPELAMKVSNELLTLILNEDVRTRTNRASETTQFLAREVKRLQGDLDTVNGQVLEAKRRLTESGQRPEDVPDQLKAESATLTAMKTDLIQKLSVYSEGHPAIKSLKKRIAALEKEISGGSQANPASRPKSPSEDVDGLEQRQTYLQQALDDANKKFNAARLGESMERDQQAEHLQVIEQPVVPPRQLNFWAARSSGYKAISIR
jgi:uncharacterized protein involved in exopolysaccharide biosynthesis